MSKQIPFEMKTCVTCRATIVKKVGISHLRFKTQVKFCSNKCRGQQWKKETQYVDFKCDYCKLPNKHLKSRYDRHEFHFCNKDCHALFREHILPKHRQPKFGTGFEQAEREKRRKARFLVNRGVKKGTLIKLDCEECGDPKSEAHHLDYDKPLEVIWLCFKHHRQLHGHEVN